MLSSSLTWPQSSTGREYWEQAHAYRHDTGKIWIKPDIAEVCEYATMAVINNAVLKVESEDTALRDCSRM